MTKKRFTWDNLGEVDAIADGDTFRWYLMLDGITDLVKFMNEQDERIQQLEMEKQVLTETLDFCKDIINHTNDSKRMKQLHKELTKVIKDD